MSKRKCPRCGRVYDSSYRQCPYCSGAGRRARPRGLLGQAAAFLARNKERIFLGSTAVLLLIAFLGAILTQCTGPGDKPGKAPEQQKQEQDPPEQPPAPAIEPLALDREALSVFVGETAELAASGGLGTPIWTTSDDAVASVDGGVVTAKAAGTATIRVMCGTQTASCTVTVTVKEPEVEVYLNRTDFTLSSSDAPFQMKVKVKETKKDYDGVVVWSSSDTNVATISETGLVERVGRGSALVTATMGGKVLECIVRAP